MLFAMACGDGEDAPVNTSTATTTAAAPVSPAAREEPTLPSPPQLEDDSIAITAVAGEKRYQPTLAEFQALPVTESGGVSGVSLAAIASQTGVEGDAVITVEGRNADLSQIRFWRGTVAESGALLVLGLDDQGQMRLAGSALAEDAWIYAVESVAFEER